jgi:uncharacterized membrane protein YkgB
VNKKYSALEDKFINFMDGHGIFLLRISLAIVYIWFGALKIAGVSPVSDLIRSTYPSFPEPFFITFLGIWEVVIGIGLLFKFFLRLTLLLLWLQIAGIFLGCILVPYLYFAYQNPLLLGVNGEFVIKNLVLVAASIVVGGYELKKKR